jgi:hypothetical protein
MPPRARKTAASKPEIEPEVLPDAVAPDPDDEPVQPAAVEPDAPAAPEAQQEPAAEPASHWELVGLPGVEDTPCRSCLPGGAPAGAGCVGCSHGQWVRVWDGA